MTPQGIAEVLDILSRVGVLGIAALVIFGFLTGRIVTKGHADEIRAERDEARRLHADALARIDEDIRRLDGSVDALSDRVRGP